MRQYITSQRITSHHITCHQILSYHALSCLLIISCLVIHVISPYGIISFEGVGFLLHLCQNEHPQSRTIPQKLFDIKVVRYRMCTIVCVCVYSHDQSSGARELRRGHRPAAAPAVTTFPMVPGGWMNGGCSTRAWACCIMFACRCSIVRSMMEGRGLARYL